ncbi:MAG: hypothetical protein KF865_12605 [Bdellovibrionaceae bacterium]|nr:hypothetical protein [Pseudobdellovibrionaceae bacterium]
MTSLTTRILTVTLGVFFLISAPAQAGYLSISESGEILPDNEYQFGLAPQLLLNEGGGANVDAFVDAPYNDSTSFRGMAGFGAVDFHIGGSVKFIPFPDIDNQPAIGGRLGAWYARDAEVNTTTIQLAPLVSRRLDSEYGRFVPYAAIPVNITSTKDRNFSGTQFVAGTEWRNPQWPNMLFTGELAINLNDSYSALNFSVAFPFDGSRGFRR